jgi:hypothetical protein
MEPEVEDEPEKVYPSFDTEGPVVQEIAPDESVMLIDRNDNFWLATLADGKLSIVPATVTPGIVDHES